MEHIIRNIIAYLKSPNTGGAFHVKGEWGGGKTYFFKNILPPKIKEECDRFQVMISLFGVGSVKEIPFKLLNAYINKKSELAESVSEDMNRGLDYLDLKYGVDRKLFGIDLHDKDELIYNIIPKEKVYFCFDDVERFITNDNVEEIMGTINNLVENLGYKVILISNDNYHTIDEGMNTVKSRFKEKVIGNAVTFIPNIHEIYNIVIDGYDDAEFSTFMKRNDISELFLPQKRNKDYRKGFENIRNMKFAISNFYDVYDHYKDSITDNKTIKRLKYCLAFIIGVSIEYKKDILTDDDMHSIDADTDVFNINLGDDEGLSEREVQGLFEEIEDTPDERERKEKKVKFDSIYRRRFYTVYAKDVRQRSVFHEELYNRVTKGKPIDFKRLEDNIQKKVFDNENTENPGNTIVSQTLDGTIFNYSDEEIKDKMQAMLNAAEDGSLVMCAAYVNAFSFLDVYKSVIRKTHEELLDIFKSGIVKYISSHEIDRLESTSLEMVAQDIPPQTKEFYAFMKEELHKKWNDRQNQGIEEMINFFKTDIPKFCSLFAEHSNGITFHYISEAVMQNVPEDVVEKRMHQLTPKDVHELAKLVIQRYTPQDIFSFHLQKEKGFLAAMKRGIESVKDDDTVSKVEAKHVLLYQVNKALRNFEIAG